MADYRVAKQVPAKVNVRPMGFSPAIRRMTVRDKEPGFHYYLAQNKDERIEYLIELGYEVVTGKADASKGVDKSQPDSRRIVAGRYVLMRCPQELYDERVAMRDADAEEATIAPRESFKTKASQMGVEPVDESRSFRAPISSIPDKEKES